MDILFTETVYEVVPKFIYFISLFVSLVGIGVLVYSILKDEEGFFIVGAIALIAGLISLCTFILIPETNNSIEYICVDKASISVEELLDYDIVKEYDKVLILTEKEEE